jgi:DNA primase
MSAAEAKAGADIVRIIGETLALEREGRLWVAPCPFHTEKSGSFTVYPEGHFHCFGCGAHCDVIDWLTAKRGMSFGEALAYLGAPDSGLRAPARPQAGTEKTSGASDNLAAAQRIWRAAIDPSHSIVIPSVEAPGAWRSEERNPFGEGALCDHVQQRN